jgi:selenide,water dikinase
VAELVHRGNAPDGSGGPLGNALDRGWFRSGALDEVSQLLLADARTSGGLLLAVPAQHAADLVAQLRKHGDRDAAIVGDLVAEQAGLASTDLARVTGTPATCRA